MVLTLVIFISISIGPIHISLSEVVKSFLNLPGKLTGIRQTVLFDIRLPRVLLALIVGSALATSGAVYQTVFRNPLADPYLLGAAAGAGLGATIALTNSDSDISNLLPLFAFLGALLAVLISFLFAGRFFNEPSTLLLAGIAISSFATAVQTYLQQRHSTSLRPVYSWILGELTTANWRTVIWSGFYVSISLTILFIVRKKLDALLLSDDEAFSLGINSSQLRFIALGAATLATATAVAASGLEGCPSAIQAPRPAASTPASETLIESFATTSPPRPHAAPAGPSAPGAAAYLPSPPRSGISSRHTAAPAGRPPSTPVADSSA